MAKKETKNTFFGETETKTEAAAATKTKRAYTRRAAKAATRRGKTQMTTIEVPVALAFVIGRQVEQYMALNWSK